MSKAAEIRESIRRIKLSIAQKKGLIRDNENLIIGKIRDNSSLNNEIFSEYEDLNQELLKFSELMNEMVNSAKLVSFRDRDEILTGRARRNDPTTSSLMIYIEHLNQTFFVPYISLILN